MKLAKKRTKLIEFLIHWTLLRKKFAWTFVSFSYLFRQWDQRFISLSNQQQLDCLFKHIEHSQDLNLWKKQTQQEAPAATTSTIKREKRITFITPNSSPPHTSTMHETSIFTEPSISCSSSSQLASTTAAAASKSTKSEWVVLPVFIDIVKLALKTRDDCSTRQVKHDCWSRQIFFIAASSRQMIYWWIIPLTRSFTCNQITKWIDKSLLVHRDVCNCVGIHESHVDCKRHRRRHSWTRLSRQSYSDVSSPRWKWFVIRWDVI